MAAYASALLMQLLVNFECSLRSMFHRNHRPTDRAQFENINKILIVDGDAETIIS